MKRSIFVLVAAFALAPSTASALAQGKHRSLSVDACWKQKLPSAFCDAVGAAAYNVDAYEWDTLAAHGQPENGQSKCQAANATVERIRTLAQDMRAIAGASTDYNPELAVALGRALHTIQDNCAHRGMPNPEHAWFSMSDSCSDTELSPDVQPEAIACAEQETAAAFTAFVAAIQVPEPPPPPEPNNNQNPNPQLWPHRGDVCDFLKSATTWDGQDRRWNNQLVVPALRDQLYQSLVVDPGAPANDVCANGEAALEPLSPVPNLDTSQPIEWCTKIQLYCAGKADSSDAAPPWEPKPEATSPTPSEQGSGCSLPARRGTNPVSLLGIALAALAAAARRRVRS